MRRKSPLSLSAVSPSQIVEDLLPVFLALRIVGKLLLQHHGDLRLREMELRQLAPDALLGDERLHQRPGGRGRLQITVVGDAQDDFANALLGQLVQLRAYLGTGLHTKNRSLVCNFLNQKKKKTNLPNLDMRRNILDPLNRLHVFVPQARTAQRLAPALLVLLVDDLLQLQRQAAQHIDMLLAVAHMRRHLLQHLQHQLLRAARQAGDPLAGHQQPQQRTNVLEAPAIAHRTAKVQPSHGLAQPIEAGNLARAPNGDVAVRRHLDAAVIVVAGAVCWQYGRAVRAAGRAGGPVLK